MKNPKLCMITTLEVLITVDELFHHSELSDESDDCEEKITSSVVIKKFKSMEKNSKWSIIEFDFFTGIYDHSVIDASDESVLINICEINVDLPYAWAS